MISRSLLLGSLCACLAVFASAQDLPPLGPPSAKPAAAAAAPSGTLTIEAANTDLKTARADNADKHYADAETLMKKDTSMRGDMPYLWIELGLAQLGQKKYDDAEASFKAAINGGSVNAKSTPGSGGFYAADGKGTHTGVTISDKPAEKGAAKHNLEIEGISNASLGEIYIHAGKNAEAKAAFDEAAKDNPAQAPLYFRNEAIFFLQAGDAADQVEAASKAIAVDPTRAVLYFYKGQGLAAQATIDSKTQKLVLPAGCADALQKYLSMDPAGPYANDAKGMLTAAGIPVKGK